MVVPDFFMNNLGELASYFMAFQRIVKNIQEAWNTNPVSFLRSEAVFGKAVQRWD